VPKTTHQALPFRGADEAKALKIGNVIRDLSSLTKFNDFKNLVEQLKTVSMIQ